MVALSATQERNLRASLAVASTEAEKLRLAFAIWTESRALIYANDGRNTSFSPFVTEQVKEVLRRSLSLPYDAVGSNGRSTGMLQQISADVGGVWGDMAGTMNPAESARRFLAKLKVTDDPVFVGTLTTPTGSRKVQVRLSDPIAADVLRVQQPLANEAESENYDASQVAIARAIVAQLTPSAPDEDWIEMATKAELEEMLKGIHAVAVCVKDAGSGWWYSIAINHFQAVNEELRSNGVGPGVLWESPVPLNYIQLQNLRNWAFSGKGNEAASSGVASAIYVNGSFV